jgi:hypothetical protein
MREYTIGGVGRIEFIAVPTPFESVYLFNQVEKREVKVA